MKKLLFSFFLFVSINVSAQYSIAREWNELLLSSIRTDYARPTVHARNLFHSSLLMYDAWAVFEENVSTVFLGKEFRGYTCDFLGIAAPVNKQDAVHQVISYGMFRLLTHRFQNSPGNSLVEIKDAFLSFGYNEAFVSTDYTNGSYPALGNYLAEKIIDFGLQDGSNEVNNYANNYYATVNPFLDLESVIFPSDVNPNRWQPIAFDVFVDQSGNSLSSNIPEFLSPEWGQVTPFALKDADLEVLNNGYDCYVYHNPGPPPYIQDSNSNGITDFYKWNFSLVLSWSSHLDSSDDYMIDISPNSVGNITAYPVTETEYKSFYNFDDGGDSGTGYAVNPITGMPYEPQLVKRADYARVLAEFWADGPDSETPPGHWFTVLNDVSDHASTIKKLEGVGEVLSDLEWDVKTYLALAGAMHDSAVTTWGIKGYYDYIRPISAIRYMASKGQSSDSTLSNFDPHGLPLIDGLIEVVQADDDLVNDNVANLGKIKIRAWKGPNFIENPDSDIAGVDWILASRWWSYQKATFVTPPFAGYLSGHSTFSSAAAKVLELVTGSPYFPNGLGEFEIIKDDFLVFENGPSETITLQWATYKDAADQASLSRIWGGIHPPIDDIKARTIGQQIGEDAFDLAKSYFTASTLSNEIFYDKKQAVKVYPNPFNNQLTVNTNFEDDVIIRVYNSIGKLLIEENLQYFNAREYNVGILSSGFYILSLSNKGSNEILKAFNLVKE